MYPLSTCCGWDGLRLKNLNLVDDPGTGSEMMEELLLEPLQGLSGGRFSFMIGIGC